MSTLPENDRTRVKSLTRAFRILAFTSVFLWLGFLALPWPVSWILGGLNIGVSYLCWRLDRGIIKLTDLVDNWSSF